MGSIVPLMRLDLASTKISALRVALQLPDSLRPQPGGVTLDVILKQDGAADREEHFLLIEATGAADLAGLAKTQRAGTILTAYQLAADDVERFEAMQRSLAEATRQHIGGSLGFGIGMREFCLTGSAPSPLLLASTYLMAPETGGWLAVTDGFDLKSDERIATGLATLRPC